MRGRHVRHQVRPEAWNKTQHTHSARRRPGLNETFQRVCVAVGVFTGQKHRLHCICTSALLRASAAPTPVGVRQMTRIPTQTASSI